MAENIIKVRQKQRCDTEANWTSKNPVLLAGEIAISSDKNGLMKVGDGKSLWTAIPYSKASLSKTDVTTALGYTPPTTNTTYSIGTSSTAGIVKLYTGTGSNTDGAMTQAAIKSALDGKSGTDHKHDLSTMINTLSTGASVPTDADYFVSQYVGGGTTTTTYHRRPVSALWSYIKEKTDGLYQTKGSYATSDHTHTYIIDCGNNASKTTLAYSKAGLGYSDYTWLAAWNGYELRAVNKNQFATSGHTHSYLPLSGGTVTGATSFTNTTTSTSTATGAVKVSGGVGVAGRMSANEVGIGNGTVIKYDSTNKCINFVFS